MPTTPRWLDTDERRAWLAYIEFSTHLFDQLNRQLRRDAGLTHTDYTLLAHLSSVPDQGLTMSELAERLKITRSRLTHAVTRLQEAGHVDRRDDPANRRNQLAVLTDQGRELLERAAPGHVDAVRRAVFDALTPEQVRRFAEIGEAINAALQRVDAAADDQEALPWRRRWGSTARGCRSAVAPLWLVAPPLSASLERGDPHRGGAAYRFSPALLRALPTVSGPRRTRSDGPVTIRARLPRPCPRLPRPCRVPPHSGFPRRSRRGRTGHG